VTEINMLCTNICIEICGNGNIEGVKVMNHKYEHFQAMIMMIIQTQNTEHNLNTEPENTKLLQITSYLNSFKFSFQIFL
jgi:hypothetical protein